MKCLALNKFFLILIYLSFHYFSMICCWLLLLLLFSAAVTAKFYSPLFFSHCNCSSRSFTFICISISYRIIALSISSSLFFLLLLCCGKCNTCSRGTIFTSLQDGNFQSSLLSHVILSSMSICNYYYYF